MAAKHCFKEIKRLREEGEDNASGRVSPDTTDATDQFVNREMKKSTRSSSRLSMASFSSSSSSSAYSSASSSSLQPSIIEEDETFCPPPPQPQSKTSKSIKKATRSSVRLSVAPCPQDEWRSLPTKPGILKLSRLPAANTVSDSSLLFNSSDSSLSCSTSLNSSRGGKGELGTRGLAKVGSRARKQLLKQVSH